jgi:hypothetical protein
MTEQVEQIERFENYGIKVRQPYSHSLEFEVKAVSGETLDPPPAGLWLYEVAGAASSIETTTAFEEGESFLSGHVKWDGCSNWDFHTGEIMAHFCSRAEAAGVGRLLDHLYQIAKERLASYEGD